MAVAPVGAERVAADLYCRELFQRRQVLQLVRTQPVAPQVELLEVRRLGDVRRHESNNIVRDHEPLQARRARRAQAQLLDAVKGREQHLEARREAPLHTGRARAGVSGEHLRVVPWYGNGAGRAEALEFIS